MAEYLSKVGNKYIWSGGYETKDMPKQAGFRWDPNDRHWWTTFRDNAARLSKYAPAGLKAELEGYTEKKEESLAMSRAASADVVIPVPSGLDYLPFQKAGIQYALKRDNVLFGDEMGLGKTIQAIGVINAEPKIKKVLVVSPASLKLNWKRELEKWLTRPASVGVAGGGLPDTDVVIVNYDVLGKFKDKLMAQDWDMLIADEAHYVKNPKAQRTVNLVGAEKKVDGKYIHVQGIADKAKRKVFLTGTPILNRPIELWPVVSTLAPETFPSFMSYAKRYADAQQNRYGWDFSGASNLGELQDKLRATIMVRRMKKDVLTELPAKRRQVVEMELSSDAKRLVARESALMGAHEERLAQHRVAVEMAKASEDEDEYAKAVAGLREAAQLAFSEISKERHELAVAKVPQVIEHLKDVLEQQDKVVIFAHHKDVIDAIMSAFPGESVKLTGDDSTDGRQKSVDAFQNDPKIRLFVGSIHAAGVGITLTAASHVVFAELDWVPGNITQAEDRLHRIGQNDSVLVQHLVFDGSLDSRMAKTLVEKQEVIDTALDIEPPPVTPIEEPATKSVSRKSLSEYVDLTDTQVAQVRGAVRFLASVDDGAVQKDHAGYNGVDTMLGQRLASLSELTQGQAKLGAILVRKYRGQLEKAGLPVPEMPEKKQADNVTAKLQEIHEQRPDSSRMQDELLSNKRTVDADDESGVSAWLTDPGSVDIVGVDTPKKPKFIKRKKRKSRQDNLTAMGGVRR